MSRTLFVAAALWLGLMVIYQLDDMVVEEGDAIPNVEVATTLLQTGALHFTPRSAPVVFFWQSEAPLEARDDFYVRTWHERHQGKAAGIWYATGQLHVNGPRYFAVKSPVREAYLSTFGPVPGLTLLPLAAVLEVINSNLTHRAPLKLAAAKLHASMLVASSAVFVLLIGLRYVRLRYALLVAIVYGLGTCVWAIASRTLWQQTVSIALIMAAIYAWLRTLEAPKQRPAPLACGLLLGTAMAGRPTALFFALALLWPLWQRRESLAERGAMQRMVAGMLPPLLAIAAYNDYYFGSPLHFGQEIIGHSIAFAKTGQNKLWQTPIVIGVTGLLFSPSRGLVIFSPCLALGFWGAVKVWQDAKYALLRPLTLAAGLTMLLQSKWFDWWGGWVYGYRPWLEAVPILALCLLPVIEQVFARTAPARIFMAALAWSIFVQGLGAFSYDKFWNERILFAVKEHNGQRRFFARETDARAESAGKSAEYQGEFHCNIDFPECRYRLWSFDDNIISYYWHERYDIAREHRMHMPWRQLLGGR
ncbi:MAG TPA: hypothetical protein VF331_04795 [Polyangiales bacterium]